MSINQNASNNAAANNVVVSQLPSIFDRIRAPKKAKEQAEAFKAAQEKAEAEAKAKAKAAEAKAKAEEEAKPRTQEEAEALIAEAQLNDYIKENEAVAKELESNALRLRIARQRMQKAASAAKDVTIRIRKAEELIVDEAVKTDHVTSKVSDYLAFLQEASIEKLEELGSKSSDTQVADAQEPDAQEPDSEEEEGETQTINLGDDEEEVPLAEVDPKEVAQTF